MSTPISSVGVQESRFGSPGFSRFSKPISTASRTSRVSLGDQARGEQDFEHAAQILHTNFVAPVSLLTWLANFCVQRRSGVLAVISSVAGERGRKSNYLYGSSKAGLTAFLAGLRNRIDRQGVTVLTIKPGPVNTAM